MTEAPDDDLGRKWTDEERRLMRHYYPLLGLSLTQHEVFPYRTRDSVARMACHMGLHSPKTPQRFEDVEEPWPEPELDHAEIARRAAAVRKETKVATA